MRRAGALVDRTQLKNPNVKVNWQATQEGHGQLPVLRRVQDQGRPQPGHRRASRSTRRPRRSTRTTPTPTSRSTACGRSRTTASFGSNMFLSAKYAYYNTGFILDSDRRPGPAGRPQLRRPRSRTARSVQSLNVRPQTIVNVDAATRSSTSSAASHDVKYGFGWRRVDAISGTLWPGNGILAIEQSPTDLQRAGVPRRASAATARTTSDFYVGDTISREPLDHRSSASATTGRAARRCRATRSANPAFPDVVPGIDFAGYDTPFTWNNFSPRAGVTYALDEARKTVARASYSRFAGQLDTGTVGVPEPELDGRLGDVPLGRSRTATTSRRPTRSQLNQRHHGAAAASTRRTRRR